MGGWLADQNLMIAVSCPGTAQLVPALNNTQLPTGGSNRDRYYGADENFCTVTSIYVATLTVIRRKTESPHTGAPRDMLPPAASFVLLLPGSSEDNGIVPKVHFSLVKF